MSIPLKALAVKRKSFQFDFPSNFKIARAMSCEMCVITCKESSYSRRHLVYIRNRFDNRLDESYILYCKDMMERDGILHLPL